MLPRDSSMLRRDSPMPRWDSPVSRQDDPMLRRDSPMLRRDSPIPRRDSPIRSEEHTSELQSQFHLVCRLLLEKKNNFTNFDTPLTPHGLPAGRLLMSCLVPVPYSFSSPVLTLPLSL